MSKTSTALLVGVSFLVPMHPTFPQGKADLSIEIIEGIPALTLPGESGIFKSTVTNNGTAATDFFGVRCRHAGMAAAATAILVAFAAAETRSWH